ncbi:MAG: NADH-quinone oxidoreductase subunit N [Fimbriimonadaceae bacterium]|nr:NADH-quinone oxidoreductase subunit N [Fimbriimonadaceae bacterium]
MDFRPPDMNLWAALPTAVVGATALVTLLLSVLRPAGAARRSISFTLFGLALAAVGCLPAAIFRPGPSFQGMLVLDPAAVLLSLLLLGATAVCVLLASRYLVHDGVDAAEAAVLLTLGCAGMLFMVSAGNLLMVFIGLETMSVALYILAGLAGARDRTSHEAALKYLLLGAFATGFLVYGMAFVYGATGSLDLREIGARIAGGGAAPGFLAVGLALLLIGLGFKVALVPFHMWAPDVYEGAPTTVAAYMAVGVKVAAFMALLRVFNVAAGGAAASWQAAVAWLAVLTMLVGNLVALAQTSLKRLLAYSSIAHAGYLAVGLAAGGAAGAQAVLFYSVAYGFMTLGAFVVLLALERADDKPQLDDLRGLRRRHPLLAAALATFMFALAGIPPLSGFLGKWLLISAAVQAGQVPLAVAAVLCSAIAAFYYLRIVVYSYMREPADDASPVTLAAETRQALAACLIGTLLCSFPFGLWLLSAAGWAAGALR